MFWVFVRVQSDAGQLACRGAAAFLWLFIGRPRQQRMAMTRRFEAGKVRGVVLRPSLASRHATGDLL